MMRSSDLAIWVVSGMVLTGLAALFALTLWLGAIRHRSWLDGRERRRHEEQLEWRRTGQLPVRYVTTYERDEMADEDMARMEELGYYVADEVVYASGSRRVVYRLGGISAL